MLACSRRRPRLFADVLLPLFGGAFRQVAALGAGHYVGRQAVEVYPAGTGSVTMFRLGSLRPPLA